MIGCRRRFLFLLTGKNPDMNRFLAAIVAVFASEKYDLGISSTRNEIGSFEMHMVRGEKEWTLKSISGNFGYREQTFSELNKKPEFWNMILTLYSKMKL